MIVLEFLDCMETELKKLFEGMVFEKSSGGATGMHIFKQDFPIRKIGRASCRERVYAPV